MNCTDFNIHTLNKGRCTCKYKFNLETNSKHSLYWNDIHILFTAADKIKQNIGHHDPKEDDDGRNGRAVGLVPARA